MIKIPLSDNQRKDMETIYWNWMSRYHLRNFLQVIENDTELKKVIVKDKDDTALSLKKFLLADDKELEQIKSAIDARGTKLQKETEHYLWARYKNYRDSQAPKVVRILGVIACPYCNQNHINAGYDKDGKFKYWGELDHFYNKSVYPELAVCLYNLIPACGVCNLLKTSRRAEIANPYDQAARSGIRFGTEFDEKFDLDYLQGKSRNFHIVIDEDGLNDKDKREIELFDLKNRHRDLKRNVQEIIIKSKAYDRIYEQVLKEGFEMSDGEIRSYIFGYGENHSDRVLSKFNMDIMNEFRNK